MNFILPFFEGTVAKCTERIKRTKPPPLDVPPYAFGQGAVPFVSPVLHYFSAAPRGLYRNHTINNERRELVSKEKQDSVLKYRNEYKCIINSLDARILSSRLGNVMQRDKNSMQNGSYLIKSLYFDNYMDAALAEKVNGVDNREKFRIRYYNNDDSYIRLEKKSKKSGLCNKLSCRISKQCCEDILKGDYGKLLDNEEMLAHEFYYKVQYKMLRPKNIVAYDREAFVYESGNERIGGGLPDNGGNITDKKILMDIDPDTDAEKFAYAEARYEVNFPVAAVTGLKKQIKNSTSKIYSYNEVIHKDEN